MSAWRRQALSALPELRACIEAASSPMSLWTDLHPRFEEAVRTDDASLVRRLLEYAAWCCSEHSGRLPNDTSTAAVCAFYEHLPDRREHWPRFAAWFSREFERLLPVFAYHLDADDLAALEHHYRGPAGVRDSGNGAMCAIAGAGARRGVN